MKLPAVVKAVLISVVAMAVFTYVAKPAIDRAIFRS